MTEPDLDGLIRTWCAMWNDDPALAHRVMTPGCVQWSATTDALDRVVGPDEQQAFVAAYRAERRNRFEPRLLVAGAPDAGAAFAYLWDVHRADGSVLTGIDVDILQGERVSENWTLVGPRRRTDPDPVGAPVPEDELEERCLAWLRERRYRLHRSLVLDPAHGLAAALRTADGDGGAEVGGADILLVRDGGVEPVWSVTGARPFRY